jgi:glycosyltransferase involved in cell wall biosynthesis
VKLAVALGGTDHGQSGIGNYVRAILPHLVAKLAASGGRLVALGTPRELTVYGAELAGADVVSLPAAIDSPLPSAVFHLSVVGRAARAAGADVLLLPAANRRAPLVAPLPTVAVVHDLAQLHVSGKYDALRMVYLRHVLLRALRHADRLVAVSAATQRDVTTALAGARVDVIPNGVDASRFAPPSEGDARVAAARATHGLDGRYLVYLARLEHPGKNHLRLLRAFAASQARETTTLVLAGKDWGARARIEEERARLGLEQRVRLLGFVPDAEVPGLVAGAEVVIQVGLHEGFGLPALEALSAGRALVASTTGALPEVTGGLAAMADPLDEGSIARALDRALQDVRLRERAAREGPVWARHFGWENTASGLFEACMEVSAS